jgi:ABC-type transport system involved in multi-copper enzyme maturation permease subunit
MTITTPRAPAHVHAGTARPAGRAAPAPIPLTRIVGVELRKSFDTRAGMWLLASIGIVSLLTTGTVIAFGPEQELSYSTFTLAIGYPMSIVLPLIAILSVTAEWSQRSGLTTFTHVPHRGRVVLAKAIGLVTVTALAMPVAFAVGALGNVTGSAIHGTDPVWDQGVSDVLYFFLANTLLLLVGFTLGVLIRASTGAIVTYFIYAFVAPTLLTFLAYSQDWFRDLRPWVDPSYSQDALFKGGFDIEQWAQLAVTSGVWLVLPLAAGVMTLLRSEVK